MASTSLWKQLYQLLQDECIAYEQLGQLLHEEWSALRKSNYQECVDIARRKEDVLTHIQRVEKERVACVRALSEGLSQEISLDWVLKCSLPESVPAKHTLKQLISVGQRVKQLSENNAGLISRGLHVVREAMNVVHGGLGFQPMYGESGSLKFPSVSTSLNVEG